MLFMNVSYFLRGLNSSAKSLKVASKESFKTGDASQPSKKYWTEKKKNEETNRKKTPKEEARKRERKKNSNKKRKYMDE